MVRVYNILNDDKNQPKLNVQREIDIDGRDISIEESVDILNEYFDMYCLDVEHAYLIGFDNQMNIIGIFLVSIGTSDICYFYNRSIAKYLLLSGTDRFILYHNHPYGTLDISSNDKNIMFSIKALANLLEIEFIDSVIISRNGWRCIEGGQCYEYDEEDGI